MYVDLFNNLAITVALLFIAGKFFENKPLDRTSPLSTRVYAGIGSGILGSLLMFSTIEVTDTVILDLRHLAVIIAAIFGGPISAILSGIIIGLVRFTLYGISETSLIVGSVVVVVSLVLGGIANTSLAKVKKYIIMNGIFIIVNSMMILLLVEDLLIAEVALAYHIPFSITGGFLTYYMAEFIKKSNENNRTIQYYKLIAENSTDVVSTHNKVGTIKYISPSCQSILGYAPSELIGNNVFHYIHPEDLQEEQPPYVSKSTSSQTLEFRFLKKDGNYVWLETTFNRMKGLSHNDDFIYSSREVSERKHMEKEITDMNHKLQKLSNLDGLTGIPNRRNLDYSLEKAWYDAINNQTTLSFILFDIDKFKTYNDTYGHHQGDACLKEVADIINNTVREQDLFARYGGEEFAVILPETNKEEASLLGEAIRKDIFNESIPNIDSEVTPILTVSVGVTTIKPSYDSDHTMLIVNADKALYQAKEDGRNKVSFYNKDYDYRTKSQAPC
ncbi:diguanylate cyclase [Pontibacillus yanchengensis]|uniref:Diguanylate cyclase n=1 Tax=Pontibacillus yanchengensis Y32 TaxID=1385514 RepID=A0A0A2TEN0_9BACI|nr:diguanylate cyclase [Pontibacillus yanchengensis]KGP72838.1 diguanylate cyclase [Pontibacillus yanchengensis Y32]